MYSAPSNYPVTTILWTITYTFGDDASVCGPHYATNVIPDLAVNVMEGTFLAFINSVGRSDKTLEVANVTYIMKGFDQVILAAHSLLHVDVCTKCNIK